MVLFIPSKMVSIIIIHNVSIKILQLPPKHSIFKKTVNSTIISKNQFILDGHDFLNCSNFKRYLNLISAHSGWNWLMIINYQGLKPSRCTQRSICALPFIFSLKVYRICFCTFQYFILYLEAAAQSCNRIQYSSVIHVAGEIGPTHMDYNTHLIQVLRWHIHNFINQHILIVVFIPSLALRNSYRNGGRRASPYEAT